MAARTRKAPQWGAFFFASDCSRSGIRASPPACRADSRIPRKTLAGANLLLYSKAMNRCSWTLVLLLLASLPSLAGEPGVIVREAPVYAQADSSSRKVGKIGAGTRVNIFERKGGWKEIFAEQEDLVGWVRSFQVREGDYAPSVEAGAESDSRGFLSGLAAFSRKASRFFGGGGSNSNTSTATIGVRGLSEEQIKTAKPDAEEFRKMQGYSSGPQRMPQFALDGQLSVNEVRHLKPKQEKRKQGQRDK